MTDPRLDPRSDPRLRRFRLRLLIAAGIAVGSGRFLPVARAGGATGDSGGGSSSGDTESSSSADETGASDSSGAGSTDGDSSTSSSSSTSTSTSSGDGGGATLGPSRTSGDMNSGSSDSAGTAGAEPYDPDPGCGGCYGRPYVREHEARLASAVSRDGWSDKLHVDGIERLADVQRDALATFWTAAALSEHSSVAGFHRFALDLLAHGAPADLVVAAQRAAVQELEHARACFGLASAYAKRELGPGLIPLGATAPIASTLVELAVWTVHEGCVGETVAAWLAAEIHEHAENPTVRAVMAKIAAEEAEHAELAWATIRWAIAVGGVPVADAVDAAFRSARARPELASRASCTSHGLLPPAEVAATMQRALVEIVRPCARRLGA